MTTLQEGMATNMILTLTDQEKKKLIVILCGAVVVLFIVCFYLSSETKGLCHAYCEEANKTASTEGKTLYSISYLPIQGCRCTFKQLPGFNDLTNIPLD